MFHGQATQSNRASSLCNKLLITEIQQNNIQEPDSDSCMLFHNHNSPSQRFHLLTRQSSDFGNSISVNTFFDHSLSYQDLPFSETFGETLRPAVLGGGVDDVLVICDLACPEEPLEDIGPELLFVWELYYLESIDFFFSQPSRCSDC